MLFIPEYLMWIIKSGWLMFLHLRARSSFPQPLGAEEEARLVAAMQEGDGGAANRLIEHNLRLVAHIAKKYARDSAEQDELVSVGALGLIKAVHTFKPENGRLAAYASRCIENEMLMYFRANRKHQNTLLFGEQLGEDKDGAPLMLEALLGTDPELVSDTVETTIEYRRAMQKMGCVLDGREQQVIRMRFGLDDGLPKPQHEIARSLGISRSYVSRIEKKALHKLREALLKAD